VGTRFREHKRLKGSFCGGRRTGTGKAPKCEGRARDGEKKGGGTDGRESRAEPSMRWKGNINEEFLTNRKTEFRQVEHYCLRTGDETGRRDDPLNVDLILYSNGGYDWREHRPGLKGGLAEYYRELLIFQGDVFATGREGRVKSWFRVQDRAVKPHALPGLDY